MCFCIQFMRCWGSNPGPVQAGQALCQRSFNSTLSGLKICKLYLLLLCVAWNVEWGMGKARGRLTGVSSRNWTQGVGLAQQVCVPAELSCQPLLGFWIGWSQMVALEMFYNLCHWVSELMSSVSVAGKPSDSILDPRLHRISKPSVPVLSLLNSQMGLLMRLIGNHNCTTFVIVVVGSFQMFLGTLAFGELWEWNP